jgi:hypothetical protein
MAASPGGDLAAPSPKSRALPSIVCGGLIAGVLDLTYAIRVYTILPSARVATVGRAFFGLPMVAFGVVHLLYGDLVTRFASVGHPGFRVVASGRASSEQF